jgi:nanoRNase/pAp phosphatase (c-di-AMP/oligoRNAs hydrolase)
MRLVTRGDLDGLVSAVLITTMEDVESIELVHPQDITDKRFEIREGDIMANLPYDPRCSVWFDHHELTESNARPPADVKGRHAIAPSVARVIYDYYGSGKLRRFARLVDETDRFDAATLAREDVLDPRGVILLGFTIDPRSGLGRFEDHFRKLTEWLKAMDVEDVLKQPEVAERVRLFREGTSQLDARLRECSRLEGAVVVTDFRPLDRMPVGNRFLVYTLFPEANVSVRLQWGPKKAFVATTVGHSIFNRTCAVNVGQLMSEFGGGGHRGAGACTLPPERAEQDVRTIVARLNAK